MFAQRSIGWWYWLATAILMTAYLVGVPGAFEGALVLFIVQVAHFRLRDGSFITFPVQIRIGYLAIFVVGMAPNMVFLHWLQTIGVWAEVMAGYCLLARMLALLPWNRVVPLTPGLIRFALFSPPASGCILDTINIYASGKIFAQDEPA